MKINYDIVKLNTIAQDLYELLHLSILITDYDGNKLVKCANPHDFCSVLQSQREEIQCACHESDAELMKECKNSGKACMRICHMNLCDIAIPITKNEVLAAYVLLGRIRGEHCNKPNIEHTENLTELYYELPYFTDKEIESLKSLLSIILFSGAISLEESKALAEIKLYIEAHPNIDLSISALCKRFFISKNTLYKLFRDEYGCTVGDFISNCRLNVAKRKLEETDDTVLKISDELGFASYAYFCHLFKSKTGLTPSDYRSSVKGRHI